MKTSIFDMNFILPPMVEMHEVVKDIRTLNTSVYKRGVPVNNC